MIPRIKMFVLTREHLAAICAEDSNLSIRMIKKIQRELNVPDDGIIGPHTRLAASDRARDTNMQWK